MKLFYRQDAWGLLHS